MCSPNPYLDSGNINTTSGGISANGNAWVLSINGTTTGTYTLNGVTGSSNPNNFANLSNSSITGRPNIAFVSGTAPSNYSPGGYSSIATSGLQQITVNTGTDSTLIVPIVSTGGFNASLLNVTGTGKAVLVSNSGISINRLSTAANNTVSIVDTSQVGISAFNSSALQLGSVITNGALNIQAGTNTLTFTDNVLASSITLSTQALTFLNQSAPGAINLFATNGNIDISSLGALTIAGNAFLSTPQTVLIHPVGDLTFQNQGTSNAININAQIVDIQAVANVTLTNNFSLISDSPIQINLNAVETLTLDAGSVLETTFAGNSSFPDPLGGTFQYSILIQNLITSFTVEGSGSIIQGGASPGYTVFNDFTNVGFADTANLTFQSVNPGSYVNFFTRQIQVNGTGTDSAPSANLTFENVQRLTSIQTCRPLARATSLSYQAHRLLRRLSILSEHL